MSPVQHRFIHFFNGCHSAGISIDEGAELHFPVASEWRYHPTVGLLQALLVGFRASCSSVAVRFIKYAGSVRMSFCLNRYIGSGTSHQFHDFLLSQSFDPSFCVWDTSRRYRRSIRCSAADKKHPASLTAVFARFLNSFQHKGVTNHLASILWLVRGVLAQPVVWSGRYNTPYSNSVSAVRRVKRFLPPVSANLFIPHLHWNFPQSRTIKKK